MGIRKKTLYSIISLAFIFIVLFSLQFSSNIILGYDGYYHIKMAEMIRNQGLIREFPWTQFNIQSRNFADLHLLYHVVLIPFTFLGKRIGMKSAILLFSFFVFIVFYIILDKENIKYSYIWILVLLFSSYPFLLRSVLGKQDMPAMVFFMGFIFFLFRKKYFALLILSYAFTLTYTLSILIIPFTTIFFVVLYFFKKKWDFKILVFPIIGYLAGLLINPYFPGILELIYVQIFEVGVIRGATVGGEWAALSMDKFLLYNGFLLVLLIFILYIFQRKEFRIDERSVFLTILSLFFLTAGLIAKRFLVFLPLFTVWLTAVVTDKFWKERHFLGVMRDKYYMKVGLFVILLLIINGALAYRATARDIRDFDIQEGIYEASQWLLIHSNKGEIVFTDEWYYFSMLFYYNSHNYYLYGNEGNFGYAYDAELFEKWLSVVRGEVTEPYPVIKHDFKASYVLVTKNSSFLRLIEKQSLLTKVFEKGDIIIYKVN